MILHIRLSTPTVKSANSQESCHNSQSTCWRVLFLERFCCSAETTNCLYVLVYCMYVYIYTYIYPFFLVQKGDNGPQFTSFLEMLQTMWWLNVCSWISTYVFFKSWKHECVEYVAGNIWQRKLDFCLMWFFLCFFIRIWPEPVNIIHKTIFLYNLRHTYVNMFFNKQLSLLEWTFVFFSLAGVLHIQRYNNYTQFLSLSIIYVYVVCTCVCKHSCFPLTKTCCCIIAKVSHVNIRIVLETYCM